MLGEPQVELVRRRLEARGLVQGVGFRPFVYRLAGELRLGGWVRNHSAGVTIDIEGVPEAVEQFAARLRNELPAPGRIDELTAAPVVPLGEHDFRIEPSAAAASGAVALVLPDVATCDECRGELFDPEDRRWAYPFLNCTRCGPRFTIVDDVPYDRGNTTMRRFRLCPTCRREYEDPGDRRFHAQPTACPVCGPRLRLLDPAGVELPGAALDEAAARLRRGEILAVKGLGGYHLACDAGDGEAVERLRRRKHREARPFAVMVADVAAARRLGRVSLAEAELLASPEAPIVLLDRRPEARLAGGLAPGLRSVGVMLAYTPLHHLLLAAVGRPLVMTSGNVTDEPIAFGDEDALERLGPLVEAVLTHDRPIRRRCDDSVVRVWREQTVPLRRSRGYAPAPLRLGLGSRHVVLAVGAHQKNAFCLLREREAFLSHHLGDLENDLALTAFETGIADFERLFELRPEVVAHDLHPDYLATEYAVERAAREGFELVAVQHHHAHIAACLADNGRDEPVLGISFDGTGLGPDGTVWGGEVLLADGRDCRRVGHLRPFLLAGGEAAVRQGWRVALALAREAGVALEPDWLEADPARLEAVGQMLDSGFRCLTTTSAGRLFDGFSALLGVRTTSRYEGEAAVLLEGCAQPNADRALPFAVQSALSVGSVHAWELDWRPAVAAAVAARRSGKPIGATSSAFHRGLAKAVARLCRHARDEGGPNVAALSGGCFQNVLLLTLLAEELELGGFEVLTHHRVPANDGGLSLGQAVVAARRTEEG